jgi:uncharacterized membrane protein YdjX (TVP38/TMEM64 family)
MKSVKHRLLAMIAVILVVGVVGLLSRQFGSMAWLVENETCLREFIRHHSWKSWLFGFSVYTAFSLIPGTSGKSVVCGWLFGFWRAVLMVDLGLTIAAVAGFLAARYTVRDAVNARFGGLVGKLDRGLANDGVYYLLMMRMAHLPFSFTNYGAGATSVSLRTFGWTTAIGILPGTMIFVFVGTRIPTLELLSQGGVWRLFDPLLFALLVSTLVFPVLIRWAVRCFRQHAGSSPEIEISEIELLEACPVGKKSNGAN